MSDDNTCLADTGPGQTCDENSDCTTDHCNNNICCAKNTCCTDASHCTDATEPICNEEFQCEPCDDQNDCLDLFPGKPHCDMESGACVECLTIDDCRNPESAPLFNSPLGICTPENTCTCVTETENDECSADDECPGNTICAQDAFNTIGDTEYTHHVCLSPCTAPGDPENGLACQTRTTVTDGQADVWVPVTSCFAFERFGKDCEADAGGTPDNNKCRLSFGLDDGTCDEVSATEFLCTYSCYDGNTGQNSWCKPGESSDGGVCDTSRLCQTQ